MSIRLFILKAYGWSQAKGFKASLVEASLDIKMDIAKGQPLTVFPSFNFEDIELGVLALPVAIFVIYAFRLTLENLSENTDTHS